jgi:hypothetical protein
MSTQNRAVGRLTHVKRDRRAPVFLLLLGDHPQLLFMLFSCSQVSTAPGCSRLQTT